MLNKQVKIAILKSAYNYSNTENWEQKFLKESLSYFKSDSIAEIIDLNLFKPKVINMCNIGLQLFALKNSLEHIEEPYILLLDDKLALINSLNNLVMKDDIYVSKYGFNRFNIKSANYIRNLGEHEAIKNSIYTFYNTQINTKNPIDILSVTYDVPFLIKKSILEKIIDRWIELTMLLFFCGSRNENPINFQSYTYTFALSITLLEYNITPNIFDVVYFNSAHNKNRECEYIFYDMSDNLGFNIPNVGAITIFQKYSNLAKKTYKYNPDNLNNIQNVFMTLLNNFIIKHIIKAKSFELIPV